jgi:hypothetical protein
MALKPKYDSLKEIPAEDVRLYIERDGAWHLDVDQRELKAKLDEMRTNNIALSKRVADYEKRFEGIDPEQVRKLAEEKRRLEEEQQLKAGETAKVIESRVAAARGDLQKQVAALSAERDTLSGQLVTIRIDQGVVSAATKRGLRSTAIPDITARARSVFKLERGVPTAFDADGQTVRLGKDGMTPMTLDEWVDQQVADAPHLFEMSAGGGAAGNGSGGAGGNRSVRNPFRKESWNLTEQMKLEKTDPALAARLRAAA